jgi:hypothetical protein
MEKAYEFLKLPITRFAVVLLLLGVLGGAVGGIYMTQIPPEQPIQFPHSLHVGLGAACGYCHPGTAWGAAAGLPTTSKCWGCHQQIQKPSVELDKLAAFAKAGKSIPWVPVAIQPDFVHFTHQPHVAAGLDCSTCHGDISKMKTAQPQPRQNMGWCLGCHQKMRPQEFKRLSDCSTCHY